MSAQKNVLLLIFDGFNTLDVNGPLEVLCNYALRQSVSGNANWNPFNITIAAQTVSNVTAFEFVKLYPMIDYKHALDMIAKKQVDVLIVPGYAGTPDVLEGMIARKDPIFGVIQAFLNLDSTDKQRWLISICVGALINAWANVFDGREATTHWGAIRSGALAKYSHDKAIVVRKRWADGGTTPNGIRVLSSGGISCGLDGMLYFISQELDLESAQSVAWMMDYVWNGGPAQPGDKPITGVTVLPCLFSPTGTAQDQKDWDQSRWILSCTEVEQPFAHDN